MNLVSPCAKKEPWFILTTVSILPQMGTGRDEQPEKNTKELMPLPVTLSKLRLWEFTWQEHEAGSSLAENGLVSTLPTSCHSNIGTDSVSSEDLLFIPMDFFFLNVIFLYIIHFPQMVYAASKSYCHESIFLKIKVCPWDNIIYNLVHSPEKKSVQVFTEDIR